MVSVDDNVYPNQGDYFTSSEPEDQAIERNQEEAAVVNASPIIQEEIGRLAQRIEFYSSIDAIDASTMMNPEDFMHAVAANKIVKSHLIAEKGILEGLLQEYAKD